MHFLRHSLPILAGILFVVNAPAFAAAPKVEEFIVGPAKSGGLYTISPTGGHIAYMGMKGAKLAVIIDGVEGPAVDELYGCMGQSFFAAPQAGAVKSTTGGQAGNGQIPVLFNSDGSHHAYAARQGGEYLVIHDGKEIARGPVKSLALNGGALTLSPTGRQVYWNEVKEANGIGSWRLMMSGKPGPWSGHSEMNPVFSADDSRYAYTAGTLANYQEKMLVIDGKEAGYKALNPVFTADGKTLLSAGTPDGKPALLANGKTIVSGFGVDKIVVAPVGNRWGAMVRTKMVNSLATPVFILDGKEVAGTEGAQSAWFSPDGKHYAVAGMNAATRAGFVVVDGKRRGDFQNVPSDLDRVTWTPGGAKVIYSVGSGGRNFVIVNEQQIPITSLMGYNKIVLPSAGDRYAFATSDGYNREFTVMIDGKDVLLPTLAPVSNTLTLSADGSRYGYFAGLIGRSDMNTVVVDGIAQPGLAPALFGKWYQMDLVQPSLIFSPDSKHVAYLARNADSRMTGLYVDGKPIYRSHAPMYFPMFTPDGRHLLWAAQEPAKVQGQPSPIVIYADGQEAVRAHGYFFNNVPGACSMDKAGVVTYFAADGDVAKRYRITAAEDTDVASAIAALQKADASALADAAAAKQKAEADAAKAKLEQEAAAAKAKADYEAGIAAKNKARQEALDAKKKAREDALKAKSKAR